MIMNLISKTLKTLTTAAAIIAATLTAGATSLAPVNFAQIVEKTEKAFLCTIGTVELQQTSNGWADKVTVKVTESWIGSANAGDTVSWLQYRLSEDVPLPGMPVYKPGEEHLIFLSAKGLGTDFQAPYALGQGSFTVHRDKENGQAYVRNAFANQGLFSGVNTGELSAVIVDDQPSAKSSTAEAKAIEAKRVDSQLKSLRAGATELGALKNAALALKKHGDGKPSQKFSAPLTPKQALANSGVLSAPVK